LGLRGQRSEQHRRSDQESGHESNSHETSPKMSVTVIMRRTSPEC
jgi:hypothetical protein